MDKNELKIRALLESTSKLTANYENDLANLRVQNYVLETQVEQLQTENERLRGELVQASGTSTDVTGDEA